jgi:hypothetical protein
MSEREEPKDPIGNPEGSPISAKALAAKYEQEVLLRAADAAKGNNLNSQIH